MKHSMSVIKLLSVSILFSTIFFSCKKDAGSNVPVGQPVQETSNVNEYPGSLPAYQIQKSEKLVIPSAVSVPDNLNGSTRVATYYAEGVQKYKAQPIAGTDPVIYNWVFVAPDAVLYDITNKSIGTHGAGPFWALTGNTDVIFAQHFTPARTAPSPEAGTIDWLMLMPKTGTTPSGIFEDVDYIQRIATHGGKAPLLPPTSASALADVPYTAIYRFTKINP